MSKLETITIDTPSGSNTMQIGSTNTATINLGVSGDTINVPAGVTIANAGTATGFGEDNTPAFQATAGTTAQSIPNETWTKINLGTEIFDTDSAFGSNKFTVPSGEGGKYSFTYGIAIFNMDDHEAVEVKLYKNGSAVDNTHVINRATGGSQTVYAYFTQILTLSASDYIELYGKHGEGASQDTNYSHTFLSGYKLSGV